MFLLSLFTPSMWEEWIFLLYTESTLTDGGLSGQGLSFFLLQSRRLIYFSCCVWSELTFLLTRSQLFIVCLFVGHSCVILVLWMLLPNQVFAVGVILSCNVLLNIVSHIIILPPPWITLQRSWLSSRLTLIRFILILCSFLQQFRGDAWCFSWATFDVSS